MLALKSVQDVSSAELAMAGDPAQGQATEKQQEQEFEQRHKTPDRRLADHGGCRFPAFSGSSSRLPAVRRNLLEAVADAP